jgi:hypothetical protein
MTFKYSDTGLPKMVFTMGSSVPRALPTELVVEKLLVAVHVAGTSCRSVRLWDDATGGGRH